MSKKIIYILPLGDINLKLLSKLKNDIEDILGFPVEINKKMEIPEYTYNKKRGQYNGIKILKEIDRLEFLNKESVLAITSVDLFTDDLNFIFGQAETPGNACIISTKRLNPEFYLQKFDEDLFYSRILKEALHELGHNFGLDHCQNKKCVMHFSNVLEDTDLKESSFCAKCAKEYGYFSS